MSLLDRLRTICLALPEVSAQLNHGMPSWVVSHRTAVQFYDDPAAMRNSSDYGLPHWRVSWKPRSPKCPTGSTSRPYGGKGWLGLRLDRDPDWDEVRAIVHDAYRLVASKRLVAKLNANALYEYE